MAKSQKRHFKILFKLRAIEMYKTSKSMRGTAKKLKLDRHTLRKWIQNEARLKKTNNKTLRSYTRKM